VASLIVPRFDPEEPWPTLGPQVEALIEERFIFGPGSLKGQPAVIDAEKKAILYSFYEVYPQWHEYAGRRRYKRCGWSVRKGLAKTEFGAWVVEAELHPEGPVRCDGFDAHGEPVGKPVLDPYIPMLAVTVEQVEELMYGALYVMVTEGPEADLFDASLERIIRLGPTGRADGKAVPLSNSPGARDGARTTFQVFDEPHRLFLPRQVQAHETMVANLEKRVLEDPWGLYVGTAGEPGEGSIAEGLHQEAEQIRDGVLDDEDPDLFYAHREAGPGYDMNKIEDRIEAIREATGPVGEYGPGQFRSIAKQWDRPKANKAYLERVWLNRWTRSDEQAFDVTKRGPLLVPDDPFKRPGRQLVTGGFDGALFRDSTALVLTHVDTGRQKMFGLWERPTDEELGRDSDGELNTWEVPVAEVNGKVHEACTRFQMWRLNADPPWWTEPISVWAGKYVDAKGHSVVEEWWTNQIKAMAYAVKRYVEALDTAAVTFVKDDPLEEAFARHFANAGRRKVPYWDEDEVHEEGVDAKAADPSNKAKRGQQLFILRKIHPDRKFDGQMAAILSWEARLAAQAKGAKATRQSTRVRRL
jgi:hypothetical protein